MENIFPEELLELQGFISSFPGIGAKTANRILIYLLNSPEENLVKFGNTLRNLKKSISICSRCHFFKNKGKCVFCDSEDRDKQTICVVESFNDVFGIEITGEFKGLYHILGGVIAPLKGKSPENLNVTSLMNRLNTLNIKEIIFALGMDTEGEITMYYLRDMISEKFPHIRITRLAYGIPAGVDLDFCDYKTLRAAIKNRTILEVDDYED